ncbi:MAG: ABC transporter ATP-binding protein [Candidatus Dormiibacterota bacterium]
MAIALEASGLGKRFGSTWAVRDLCISIPAGRVVALVGPNGAGKTTLLQLAVGLLTPDTGDPQVFGWSPRHNPTLVLARVGFLAQERPLYKGFTVAETLRMGRESNPKWDQALAEARMRRLEIPMNRRVGKLSGGQQAQVALALALGKRPELLLLDEPVANLDPLARRQFLAELMESVAAEGLTVVLSSHLIADLERLADHLVILAGGRLQVAGDLEPLLEDHHWMVGPTEDVGRVGGTVVQAGTGERQCRMLVRNPAVPRGWTAEPVTLEDLVLAYLGNPDASALAQPEAVPA